jgi:hypothetical protein
MQMVFVKHSKSAVCRLTVRQFQIRAGCRDQEARPFPPHALLTLPQPFPVLRMMGIREGRCTLVKEAVACAPSNKQILAEKIRGEIHNIKSSSKCQSCLQILKRIVNKGNDRGERAHLRLSVCTCHTLINVRIMSGGRGCRCTSWLNTLVTSSCVNKSLIRIQLVTNTPRCRSSTCMTTVHITCSQARSLTT